MNPEITEDTPYNMKQKWFNNQHFKNIGSKTSYNILKLNQCLNQGFKKI